MAHGFLGRMAVVLAVFLGGLMAEAVQARTLRVVALGDSLTAGFGLGPSESFPAVLQRELRARGHDVEVVNFGVSGDTTAGGVARVGAALAARPDALILELGANDGLRGFDPALVRANLERILAECRKAGVPVLLAGMRALLGMGKRYGDEFAAVFADLARSQGLAFYPFFLEGVAGDPSLNLPDGLHPNARGVEEIVRRMLPMVEAFLKGLPAKP